MTKTRTPKKRREQGMHIRLSEKELEMLRYLAEVKNETMAELIRNYIYTESAKMGLL